MKILFVIKAMSWAGGGAERVLAAVTEALVERGHEVQVASFDPPDTEDFYELDGRVIRHRIGVGSIERRTSLADLLQRVRALTMLHDGIRPDVAIGFMHSSYLPLGLALRRRSTPVIASEHIDYSHWKRNRMEFMAIRALLPLFSAMSVVSEVVRNAYPLTVADKMVPIGNPVTFRPTRMADVEGGSRKTLLSVGRLTAQKDHRTLVDAFAKVSNVHPDWDVRIVGEGEQRKALEAQIRTLGLKNRVFLPGSTHSIKGEYRSAQLYVHPALYESFGLVTAEALAHGLPAIGFADCSGTNEIILDGDNGMLVHGRDRAKSLAIALDRLMGSVELRKQLGTQGPPSVERFSISAVADAWESLLFSVAGRHLRRTIASGSSTTLAHLDQPGR